MLVDALFNAGSFSWYDLIIGILSSLLVIFLTMPIHEFAHAWTATKLGDPTPRFNGRLSVNPFVHIDYMGALCILLFGFGWAKPVGVNPRNFDNPKIGMAVTAFAGPLSNLILALISLFGFYGILAVYPAAATAYGGVMYIIAYIFYYIAFINVSLAVFNLLPIPPLDGSRLLAVILPNRLYYKIMQYERYIYYGVLILIFVGAFDLPLSFLTTKIMTILKSIPKALLF